MTVSSAADVRLAVGAARRAGRTIGLVPTMGALHAGHVSLIDAARRQGNFTIVSIYVNPAQFGPNEDIDAYPRCFGADRATCSAAGVDLIFAPDHDEVYPAGDQTRVRPGALADTLCGPFRPGHFDGVCTVVAKLFNLVQPDVAYFGRKDAQQAVVIRRMVEDLRMPVRIEVCPIIREPDGLAMSSRNVYLNTAERERSLCLYHALLAGRERLLAGETSMKHVHAAMRKVVEAAGDVTVDYLSIVNPDTLAPVTTPSDRVMIAGAIRIGGTRLIDNVLVETED
ncbi:MAG: pantoate--beta-alanine ligase [Phycisphaerae bacterium]